MKTNVFALLMIATLFLTAAGCSKHKNSKDVPEAVIVKFDEDHQKASNVYWEPADGGFQATFKDGGIEKVAIYTSAGKPKQVQYVVEEKEIPVLVVNNIKKKYPKVQIEHITYMEVAGRKPYYVMRTRDPRAVSSIEINLKGIVIRRTIIENLVVVKASHDDHDDCHGHHKHKKKHGKGHGHGHGNCKHDHGHDNHGSGIVIKL